MEHIRRVHQKDTKIKGTSHEDLLRSSASAERGDRRRQLNRIDTDDSDEDAEGDDDAEDQRDLAAIVTELKRESEAKDERLQSLKEQVTSLSTQIRALQGQQGGQSNVTRKGGGDDGSGFAFKEFDNIHTILTNQANSPGNGGVQPSPSIQNEPSTMHQSKCLKGIVPQLTFNDDDMLTLSKPQALDEMIVTPCLSPTVEQEVTHSPTTLNAISSPPIWIENVSSNERLSTDHEEDSKRKEDPQSTQFGKAWNEERCDTINGLFSAPMQVLGKRKATEDPNRIPKRRTLLETGDSTIASQSNANELVQNRDSIGHGPNTSSPSLNTANSISRSSLNSDTSDTDFELTDANGNYPGSAEDGNDGFFGKGEDRIVNPENYFKKLAAIERSVAINSALRYWRGEHNLSSVVFTNNLSGSSGPCLPRHLTHPYGLDHLITIVECRNDIARVLYNAISMRGASYSTGTFSLLVLDHERDAVARLVPFKLTDIMKLFEAFELACVSIELCADDKPLSWLTSEPSIDALTTECKALWNKFGLGPTQTTDTSVSSLWRCTVHVLDFGLLSYAGAHVEAFDERYLGRRFHVFRFPHCSNESTYLEIAFRRRRLQCLDEFLGYQDVWVFHPHSLAPDPDENSRLLLSTRIETIADVWGPMWKVMGRHGPGIEEYNIGNGIIIPWRQDRSMNNPTGPPLKDSEKYCHWISARKYRVEEVKSHQEGISCSFDGTELLLIGAAESPTDCSNPTCRVLHKGLGLKENLTCRLSCEDLLRIKSTMKDKGALKEPLTEAARRYKNSHAVQV